jgi:hypothetical protein
MARINIEECWWSDPRREKLGKLLGNTDLTETVVVRSWRLAQEFWSKGKLVPGHIFLSVLGAEALLFSGLARLHKTEDPTSESIRLHPSRSQARVQQHPTRS